MKILLRHPGGISEHELLEELGYTRGGELELFRAHFMLFNLLYRLRDRLLLEKRYILSIFCLEIRLDPWRESAEDGSLPAEADPVRDYYLDPANLEGMDLEGVRRMLDSFYLRLRDWYRREEDYALLGLRPGAGREALSRRYRSLVLKNHPDRGGEPARFREIQEAMERIKRSSTQ